MDRFKGKTAIVTGAATGIGYAIAEQLVSEGAKVIINDLDEGRLRKAEQTINSIGFGRCFSFAGDVSDVDCIGSLVAFAIEQTGKLDLTVANAGLTHFGGFLECTPEEYRKVTDLNLQGSFFLVQESARQMQCQKQGGRILVMSSVAGIQACPQLTLYAMTKAALRMMVRSLVVELGPLGIGINAIAPGATVTNRTLEEEPDYEGTWSTLTPNKRPASVRDIAEAGAFLLSEAAAQINGQTLVVDGGWTNVSPYPGLPT